MKTATLLARTGWRSGWLPLYAILAASQVGHLFEHGAQMVQIHGLGLTGRDAHGIIGRLDVEWVHFAWNAWIVAAVLLLLHHFPGDRWLWLALVVAGWHLLEHSYLLTVYLSTGVSGTPGLLGAGGAIAGGTVLRRPDLHFLYNLVETFPLLAGFLVQLGRTTQIAPQPQEGRLT